MSDDDVWPTVRRGGIQFGPGPCPSRSPGSGAPCEFLDSPVQHRGGRHTGLVSGMRMFWPMVGEDWGRWAAARARPREEEHRCAPPGAQWAESAVDWGDMQVVWTCSECQQQWELEEQSCCWECGRANEPRWLKKQGSRSIVASGGWSAPVGEVLPVPLEAPTGPYSDDGWEDDD